MNTLASPPPSFTAEEKAQIEQQLEKLVRNPHFSQSRRFPSFLRYIVAQTLAGNGDHLKERTLGVEIFGKDANYDTSTEPIVRVTAAEIRKRIAQYYQEPAHRDELRLSLPPGSYIPQFEFRVGPAVSAPAEPTFGLRAAEPIPPQAPALERAELAPTTSPVGAPGKWPSAVLLGSAAGLVVAAIVLLAFWFARPNSSEISRFWQPVLSSSQPILFSVADQTRYGSLSLRDAGDPSHQIELKDNLTAVVIDDLTVITKMAGVLQSFGKPYNLRGENATTLSDLRGGPSVIVGAFDNAWTLRLLAPLRFRFVNNPQMTRFSIVDSKGASGPWTVDRTQQLATNNYEDYAIVARFTDTTTGQPTLIAAGIGRGGTIAAGEFLTTPALLRQVLRQQPGRQPGNVEVVLRTQIIDGEPGTPTIAAVYYW